MLNFRLCKQKPLAVEMSTAAQPSDVGLADMKLFCPVGCFGLLANNKQAHWTFGVVFGSWWELAIMEADDVMMINTNFHFLSHAMCLLVFILYVS